MDPISALIGGGASIIGSFMNTSSAQSINAAQMQQANLNRQFSIDQARGQFLPEYMQNLVGGATAAGLNPLAALGIKSPGGGPQMPQFQQTEPGRGLQELGRNIAQIDLQKHELSLQDMREDIARKAAVTKQTMIDNAVKLKTLEGVEGGKYLPPGVSEAESTWPSMVKRGLENFTNLPTFNPATGGPDFSGLPQEPWDWTKYVERLWTSKR